MSRPAKYESFGVFLASQSRAVLPMSFRDIERVLDAKLPPSKRQRAWWSNNAGNNVMTRQWLAAGYVTEQVDIAGERVVFRRVAAASDAPDAGQGTETASIPTRPEPLFGCMIGTLVLSDDVDLTAPADADWAKVYEDG